MKHDVKTDLICLLAYKTVRKNWIHSVTCILLFSSFHTSKVTFVWNPASPGSLSVRSSAGLSSGWQGDWWHHSGHTRASGALLGPGQLGSGEQESSGSASGGDAKLLLSQRSSQRLYFPADTEGPARVRHNLFLVTTTISIACSEIFQHLGHTYDGMFLSGSRQVGTLGMWNIWAGWCFLSLPSRLTPSHWWDWAQHASRQQAWQRIAFLCKIKYKNSMFYFFSVAPSTDGVE